MERQKSIEKTLLNGEWQLAEPKDFVLKDIFECGQCFRWKREAENCYIGVIKDGVIRVQKEGEKFYFSGITQEDFIETCKRYFDLQTDYSLMKETFSKEDENLRKAVSYGSGIRILKQDPWEMLISYIISACNNIPRISKTIENLSSKFGKKVFWQGKPYFLFPTPKELSNATMEDLRNCNLGFRDRYVWTATRMVLDGSCDLMKIQEMDYENAKKELQKIPGVGAKVADCILLFSMGKTEAFPVDTWIKKVMKELYIESANVKQMNQYAIQKFGKYAGVANQYLFYYKKNENSPALHGK